MDKLTEQQKEILIYRLECIYKLIKEDKSKLAISEVGALKREIESDYIIPF